VSDWLTLSFEGLPDFTQISTVYQGFSDKSDGIFVSPFSILREPSRTSVSRSICSKHHLLWLDSLYHDRLQPVEIIPDHMPMTIDTFEAMVRRIHLHGDHIAKSDRFKVSD